MYFFPWYKIVVRKWVLSRHLGGAIWLVFAEVMCDPFESRWLGSRDAFLTFFSFTWLLARCKRLSSRIWCPRRHQRHKVEGAWVPEWLHRTLTADQELLWTVIRTRNKIYCVQPVKTGSILVIVARTSLTNTVQVLKGACFLKNPESPTLKTYYWGDTSLELPSSSFQHTLQSLSQGLLWRLHFS